MDEFSTSDNQENMMDAQLNVAPLAGDGIEFADGELSLRLQALAAQFMNKVNWDRQLARVELEKYLRAHSGEYLDEMTALAARYAVGRVVHSKRSSLITAAPKPSEALMRGMVIDGKKGERELLDKFRLSTGMALGDCTRDDLIAEIKLYQERAAQNARMGRWLQMIADKVGSKRVRETFTEAQIERLKARAEQD